MKQDESGSRFPSKPLAGVILPTPTTPIPDPRTVLPKREDREEVRTLETGLLKACGALPGVYSTWKPLEHSLIPVHDRLMDALCEELARLDTLELCKSLYDTLEILYGYQKRVKLSAAPDLILRGRPDSSIKGFDLAEALGPLTLGIRYLIEMSLKYSRCPGLPPTKRQRLFLIALASRIVELDDFMEHICHQTIPYQLVIDREYTAILRLSDRTSAAVARWKRDAQQHMLKKDRAELAGLSESLFKPVKEEEIESSDLWRYLDLPMKEELGYGLTDWMKFIVCLLKSFGEKDRILTIRRQRLEASLRKEAGLAEDKIARLFQDKTLSPRLLKPVSRKEMLPAENFWRDLRIINRPLVEIEHGRTPLIIFGIETVESGSRVYVDRLGQGKFPAAQRGGPIEKAIGAMNTKLGDIFRDELAQECRRRDFEVRTEKGNAGNVSIPGNIGPVDVFVVDRSRNRFVLAETKDISGGSLSARDIKEQRERFIGNSKGKTKSFLEKVRAQEQWFGSHVDILKKEFGISNSEVFTVEGAIISNSPLLWVYLAEPPLPILDDIEFVRRLTTGNNLLTETAD